jgi:hypothetical protein
MTVITERDARHGMFLVFKDPEMKVKIRSMNDTETWLDECEKIDEAWAAAETGGRAEHKAYTKILYDCFLSYDGSIDRDKIEGKVTAAQVVEAVRVMREEFDPFVQTQKQKQKDLEKQQADGLEMLRLMPKEVAAEAMKGIKDGTLKL